MLTSDLVRVRRRGETLEVIRLNKAARERAKEMATQYIAIAKSHIGKTRGELDEAMGAIEVHARDRKVGGGLRKLIADRCELEIEEGTDPLELRQEVFTRASAARKALAPGQRFEPGEVLADVARKREVEQAELERLLYVDLRSAHRLLRFESLSASALLELYELGQAQAVLLRAVRMVARVQCSSPGAYRAIFRKLKFLRLLHVIEPITEDAKWAGGYCITIDGPYSLFRSVSKYGLKLAQVLPLLRACDRWAIEAQVRWGKERKELSFATCNDDDHRAGPSDAAPLPDEVAGLLAKFGERHKAEKTSWLARSSSDILELPGVGLCVPDLIFEHSETGVCIYLEVMGFWSRDAVWKRVELVERGLPYQIVFAVSSRLRVSEAGLDADLPSSLYVYKGAMSPKIIEEHLDRLANQKVKR